DEGEAFAVLRTAAMHSNRRVGQVSKQVIATAHYADAVNRAGKLRMLSQRLVKLVALCLLEPGAPRHAAQRPRAGGRSAGTAAWAALADGAADPPSSARLVELDALAEHLLLQADQLTGQLETAGLGTTLHVINLSGRQRMLSQRHAK